MADFRTKGELDAREYQKLLNSTKIFQAELVNADYTLSELTELALKHAEEREGVEEGNYVRFLNLWISYYGETKEQKERRLICNFVRHKLTSYDSLIEKSTKGCWVPREFFDYVWNQVMIAIVSKYPFLGETYRTGVLIKRAYESFSLNGRTEDVDFNEFLFSNF